MMNERTGIRRKTPPLPAMILRLPWQLSALVRREPVPFCFIALLAAAALADWNAAPKLLLATGKSLIDIAPFLIISVLLAALAKATGADRLIARALSGHIGRAVILAAIFGALSPFCSCGVVPLIAAMLASGAPLAPVMAFWLASPVIDPEMLILTWGILGPEMAIAKTLAAIGLGLLGGGTVMAAGHTSLFRNALRVELSGGGCASTCAPSQAASTDPVWRFWQDPARRRLFSQTAAESAWFLGKWLTLAFLIEAMMLRWVPMDSVGAFLTGLGDWATPVAASVGVPAYLNGYAAIPLVRGLMDAGLAPGPALSFMVAGGATSIPAALAVHALVRQPVFITYLLVAFVGSVAAGFLYTFGLYGMRF